MFDVEQYSYSLVVSVPRTGMVPGVACFNVVMVCGCDDCFSANHKIRIFGPPVVRVAQREKEIETRNARKCAPF